MYAPLIAPPTSEAFRWANERFLVPRVVRDLGEIAGPRPVVVAYPPTRTTLDLISGLDPRLVLYDCSDDYEQFPGVPKDIARTERELLLRADLVSCTSQHLLEKDEAPQARRLPERPRRGLRPVRRPARSGLRREVATVCFFGDARRERIDFESAPGHRGAGFRTAPGGRPRRRGEEAS